MHAFLILQFGVVESEWGCSQYMGGYTEMEAVSLL